MGESPLLGQIYAPVAHAPRPVHLPTPVSFGPVAPTSQVRADHYRRVEFTTELI